MRFFAGTAPRQRDDSRPESRRDRGIALRGAGVFSELVLGFVAVSLALTAFTGTPSAEPTETGPAAAVHAGPADGVGPPPDVAAPDLARWAAPALAKPAAPATETAPPAIPADVAQPVIIAPTAPPPAAAAVETVAAPVTAHAPIATVASPPPAANLGAAAGTEPSGGTPGLKPAKVLFGAVATPAPLAARAIGTYAKGCLSGAQALPVDGPAWQAMRLSRNRNWGHPKLIALVEKLAMDGKAKDGWPGLLVGDIAQPRGGPMLTGHASHQIGLDADIWLTPMPDRTLTHEEREKIEATSMLGEDETTVNGAVWTEAHLKILKRAASYHEVERILVHPAIKQVLCFQAGSDREWLSKVRPYWGHYYHFHVRISCPPGSANCTPQKSVPGDDGCGKELDDWLKLIAKIKLEPAPLPIPQPPAVAAKEKPAMTLDQLPAECRVVLATGNPLALKDVAAAAKVADKVAAPAKSATAKAAALPAASGVGAAKAAKAPQAEKKTATQ